MYNTQFHFLVEPCQTSKMKTMRIVSKTAKKCRKKAFINIVFGYLI